MKIKNLFQKAISVAVAMSMVFSIMPGGGISNVSADTQTSDQLFTDSLSSFTVSQWQDDSSTYTGFKWNDADNGDLEHGWSLYNGDSTGTSVYCYQTISKLYPGTYTLTATLSAYGKAGSGSPSDTTRSLVYAYVDGNYVSSSKVRLSSKSQSFSFTFTVDETVTNYSVGYYTSMYAKDWFTITGMALSGEWEVDESELTVDDAIDYSIEETETDNIVQKDRYFRRSSEGNSYNDTSLSDYWGYEYITPGTSDYWTKNTDSSVTAFATMNNYDGTDAWFQNIIWKENVNLVSGTYTFSLTMSNWDSNTSNITVKPYVYASDMTGITIPEAVEVTGYGYGNAAAISMIVECESAVSSVQIGFTITCPAGCGGEFSDAIIVCSSVNDSEEETYNDDEVKGTAAVNNGNFIKGVDISSIISEEAAGTEYSDNGEKDIFMILKNKGINYVRIRIWNDPYNTSGITYGGGSNDAETAVMIAQRATDAGLGVFLSFHLSDFWADPGAQIVPKAWSSYSTSAKASAAKTFILDTIADVKETGADVGIVTVGNENNWKGIAGTGDVSNNDFSDYISIVKTCYSGIKAEYDDILVGIHVTPSSGTIKWQPQNMSSSDSTFLKNYCDVYSISMYPYLDSHATTASAISTIASELDTIANNYNVYTMITEFNYPWTSDEVDTYHGLDSSDCTYTWDISTSGQSEVINQMYSSFSTVTNMLGMFYWEPAWIPAANDTTSSWSNRLDTWYNNGCGIATYYGASYLSWGWSLSNQKANGSEPDNKSLFNTDGTPFASLSTYGELTDDYSPFTINVTDEKPQVKAQISTPDSDGYMAIRFVGFYNRHSLSDDDYTDVGFKFEYAKSTTNKTALKTYTTDTNLYTGVIADGEKVTNDDGLLYAYAIRKLKANETYYFKVIPIAKGSYTAQGMAKYYKLDNGELSEIEPWEYQGSNAAISHSKMNGTTNKGVFSVYPDTIK